MQNEKTKVAIVTGACGFIGFHLSQKLLDMGWRVVGVDNLSDYYDPVLKKSRESFLIADSNYRSIHANIETPNLLIELFEEESPDVVYHLAAQAGVRHSIEHPRLYLESNIIGTFELLEAARKNPPEHMLLASTSSAYGANKNLPFKENDKSDHQISFYAATKKSSENIAHSYSHLFNLPITMFRFFTVYGPWGRPDMALFKFTKAILDGDPIDVYNYGKMSRDFTYIDDIVNSMISLINKTPITTHIDDLDADSRSPVAPFRVVNIGNSKPENLSYFIAAIEKATGMSAVKNLMPMQAGDVEATWADTSLLASIVGSQSQTSVMEGVQRFVDWYRSYYNT